MEQGRYHLDFCHPSTRPAPRQSDRFPCRGPRRRVPEDGLQHKRRARDRDGVGRCRRRVVGSQPGVPGAGLTRSSTGIPASRSRAAPRVACGRTTRCCRASSSTPPATSRTSCVTPRSRQRHRCRDSARTSSRLGLPTAGMGRRPDRLYALQRLLGRVHLSGHIDRMSAAQQRLVADGVSTYKRIRPDLATRGTVLAARAARLGRPVGGPRDAGALWQLSGCLAPRACRRRTADRRLARALRPRRDGPPGRAHARRARRWRKCFTPYGAARRSIGARRRAS